MVMEAPPSPQCVGREFVRQYYTLLNQAPAHLHRFYNNNSSFVHGGLDAPNRETKPVVGQKQIHQKIQQLNFRDCHAKISQVDSQATLGDGVVVQVTGELSNSGQPMRRFTQTFVLAAQSPKKYYVHNDIFRYQDMIFSDEEVEQDSGRSEAEEDAEPEHSPTADAIPPSQQLAPQQTMAYYNNANTPINNTAAVASGMVTQQPSQPQPQQQQQPPQLTAAALTQHQQMAPPPSVVPAPLVATAIVNGTVHPEEVISAPIPIAVMPSPVTVAPSIPQQVAIIPTQTPIPNLQPIPQAQIPMQQATAPGIVTSPGLPAVIKSEEEEVEQDNVAEDDNEEEQEGNDDHDVAGEEEEKTAQQEIEDTHHHSESVLNEPKTYATLVKSGGTGVGIGSLSSTLSTSPNAPAKPTTSPPPLGPRTSIDARDSMHVSGGPGSMGSGQRGSRGGTRGPSIRGMVRNERGGSGRGSFNDDNDGDRRRMGPNMMQQYPDSQQLFMGNLPLHATEDDLKDLFGKFGHIIDLRIHSKSNNKGVPGNRVPNYGFITFEDANTVQQVLNSRPFYFPQENGQKLNVEEKKARGRQSMDGGRMGSGGDAVMGRPSPSGLGGPRAVPGMMRGGTGMGHHRGGGRGSFTREGRGGGMNRGAYARR
ncbi:ras GTPase-activating protein-binding protein 1 isoform X2 [Zootermopsis nevadensis]|uniref:ras GTPase-activating protein-binding protein 1 isoform X2 n=1 Tax=Zootermopsis nevadensis TaxID=136037 RepID=UPI000B8E861F|nr:ras GTPase-activating protein-binding protein 1 isoform X2 [Zootermopsis nevadensis]